MRAAFQHYVYPGIYQYQDFHHCGLEPNDNIVNYDNKVEVWTCQLEGLAEYAFASGTLRSDVHRAPAWQRIRSTLARNLPNTRMISSIWESTAYVWMQQNVCTRISELGFIEFM